MADVLNVHRAIREGVMSFYENALKRAESMILDLSIEHRRYKEALENISKLNSRTLNFAVARVIALKALESPHNTCQDSEQNKHE